MSKLFNFPDDGAEEAETAHRSPRTPSAHECEPAATGISQKGHPPPRRSTSNASPEFGAATEAAAAYARFSL